ncbi:MAG: hypothetical protein M1826_004425 [Phylliscum demangeonii]|nr:MAG: hypothetical protein M1826_004425 [Phylliscum demangeonii]
MLALAASLAPRAPPAPGIPPPPGVAPDFHHPNSLAKYCILTPVLALAFSTLFVFMRMYTKLYITRSPGWDDYVALFAWVFAVAYSSVSLAQLPFGLGLHSWNIPRDKYIRLSQLSNVLQVMYPALTFVVKLSILMLYYRIFAPSRGTKRFITLIMTVLLGFYTANMFVKIFLCSPRQRIWDKSVPGHCANLAQLYLATAIVNVVSDFYILVLPLPSIWHLQIPLRRRLGLISVFSAGLFACVSSILRLYATVKSPNSPDQLWSVVPIQLWTLAEINVGLICACLPALPSFYHHFFPNRSTIARTKATYGTKDSCGSRKATRPLSTAAAAAHLDAHDHHHTRSFTQGKYLELGELQEDAYSSPTSSHAYHEHTSRMAGVGLGPPQAVIRADSCLHAAKAGAAGGILRTIDVEQSISEPVLAPLTWTPPPSQLLPQQQHAPAIAPAVAPAVAPALASAPASVPIIVAASSPSVVDTVR